METLWEWKTVNKHFWLGNSRTICSFELENHRTRWTKYRIWWPCLRVPEVQSKIQSVLVYFGLACRALMQLYGTYIIYIYIHTYIHTYILILLAHACARWETGWTGATLPWRGDRNGWLYSWEPIFHGEIRVKLQIQLMKSPIGCPQNRYMPAWTVPRWEKSRLDAVWSYGSYGT